VIKINHHKYKIIKQLGEGGFGIVFEAIDVDTGGCCNYTTNSRSFKSKKLVFRRNHKTISENPSVPRVPKFITSSDVGVSQYLVMEYIPGELSDVYHRHLPTNYFPSGPKAIMFFLQTLETLDAIHQKESYTVQR